MNWEDFGNSYEEIVGVLESDSTQEAEPKFLDSSAITAGNLLDDDLIVLEDASSWEIIYLNDLSLTIPVALQTSITVVMTRFYNLRIHKLVYFPVVRYRLRPHRQLT